MRIEQASSIKQLHKWQRGHVWLLWRFRGFVEKETEATKAKDDDMRRHWWDKRNHVWSKIQQLEQRALRKGVKLEEMQVDEFTQTVLKMIAQGKHPTQILEELGQEKKDKSPPSNPRSHRLVA